MDTTHKYRTMAQWSSGQTGLVKSDSILNAISFSAPPQFGGPEGQWSPEDLLLAALASCFAITFRAMAGNSKFEYTDLQVEVEGTVSKAQSGYGFTEITLRPSLAIHGEDKRERALNLLQKAKTGCLISKALAIVPGLEPDLKVGNAVSAG